MKRSLTFLDASGDTTIAWDEDCDSAMLDIISKKLKEGYVFYILKPRNIPFLPPKKIKVTHINQVKETSSVIFKDNDIIALLQNGQAQTTTVEGEIDVQKKSKNITEISTSQTAAFKPARGG